MKLFIPAVGYRIRLTSDWSFPVHFESRNDSLLKKLGKALKNYWGDDCFIGERYESGLKSVATSLPAGTVLEVDRVYVRAQSKSATSPADDYDSITFKVVGEKPQIRFWVKLDDANKIEYELPEDAVVSKEEARKKAQQPKKLKPDTVRTQVSWALSHYNIQRPIWLSDELITTFSNMAREYEKRQRPLDHIAFKQDRFYWVDVASYKKDRFVSDVMLERSYRTILKTRRDEQGRLVRRYTNRTPEELAANYGRRGTKFADVTDMWIEVVSNAEDTEIVEVRAGYTPS